MSEILGDEAPLGFTEVDQHIVIGDECSGFRFGEIAQRDLRKDVVEGRGQLAVEPQPASV